MNFRLVKITRTEVQVEVPDVCPECYEPFTPAAAARQGRPVRRFPISYFGVMNARQDVAFGADETETDYDMPELKGEFETPTEVQCALCNHVLATTEVK
jgi:hypothetical protein